MADILPKKTFFLTGATGLVGSYLLKILLENGHKVFALARNKDKKNARERVIEVLAFWNKTVHGKGVDKLIVIEGDIRERNIGLCKKKIDWLRNEIEEIVHCAAITQLSLPFERIKTVNIDGTKRILDLALQFRKPIVVNHISTAFVCGNYLGKFREKDLDVHQKFGTSYEKSKFEAEVIVRKYRNKGLWIDIFRLPIVVGESTTGRVLQEKNIYQIINLCKSGLFEILPFKDLHLHVVPVDLASLAIYKLMSNRLRERNYCYHIFNDIPFSLREIIIAASKKFRFRSPKLVSLSSFDYAGLTASQRHILDVFSRSINFRANFDSRNTLNFLKKIGFLNNLRKWRL